MKYVIFDLDGTVSDPAHRLHLLKEAKIDWPSFYLACKEDDIIYGMRDIWLALQKAGFKIIVVTGRSDICFTQTTSWLIKHGLEFEQIYMRRDGDWRKDHIIKEEVFLKHIKHLNPVMVFEDRQTVVDMWRRNGILCLQCADGKF